MLASVLPMFDKNSSVGAYSLFAQKENQLLEPRFFVTAMHDGACNIDGLEVINKMGADTLTGEADIFVPINNVSLFADIESQCNVPHSRLVLLVDNSVKPIGMYIDRLTELKEKGYKLAIWKLQISDFEPYKLILNLMDYILINSKKVDSYKAKLYFNSVYPNIKLILGNIRTMEEYEEYAANSGYDLFEGPFYRLPITKGQNEVAPLKINYLQLLNLVNEPDYDLSDAADVIGRDTALVISLLKIVNKISRNSEITTIKHAVAMLGQKELKRWIITAVTKQLCFDKPNEITRLSLLRARMAENLADVFGLRSMKQELFLLGLFSVLDIILDKPMKEALDMVNVSADIKKALIDGEGKMAEVLSFITAYESANWSEVSRVLILRQLGMDDVYKPYCDALAWYKQMFFE